MIAQAALFAATAPALSRPVRELVLAHVSDWSALLHEWAASAPAQSLMQHVDRRVAEGVQVYPAALFRALELTPRCAARVVVLGQDPYHGAGQAEGLAFSVPVGQRLPPSLRNVFAELQRDLGHPPSLAGHLGGWARQGVLLLNSCLSVEQGRPASHAKLGWEALTDKLIAAVAAAPQPKVFMLWGAHAQAKAGLIARAAGAPGGAHLVLCCNHPSPLSARRAPLPFLGCGHFGQAQDFLARQAGATPPIDWSATGAT